MSKATALRTVTGATLLALALAACGPDGPVTNARQVEAPRPPYPAWAVPMIGKPMSQFVHGHGSCKGVFDAVMVNYNGSPPGSAVGGWGWDLDAKQAVPRLLFVDLDDRIVGAGNGGVSRPDVSTAIPAITSKTTGWTGVVGMIKGKILAVGVTSRNAPCDLGSAKLEGETY